MTHRQNIMLAASYGALGAVAWAWWALAVAIPSPTQAALADLAIISLSALNVNFIAQRRYAEFAAYTLAAAVGTWVTIYFTT